MANNVFADLGLPHADELKAASDRARSYDEFRKAADAILGIQRSSPRHGARDTREAMAESRRLISLRKLWNAILTERIPDDLRELVERLK